MATNITLKALGLNSSPNQLETPPGSLLKGENIVIRDNDIISQRRGFSVYGSNFGSAGDRAKQLFSYRDRIIRYFSTKLEFDMGTTTTSGVEVFSQFAGDYNETEPGLKIKSVESNGNLYFTTAEGIKKISAKTANEFTTAAEYITQAGGIKALDLTAHINYSFGDQTGFLPADSAVAYRVLWLYKDANDNLIQGTPSQRAVVYNSLATSSVQDINFVLGALDDINQTGSMITFGQFVSTFGLPINASPSDLYNNLLLLATQLDNSIVYADQTATAPLQISMASAVNGIGTVSFSTGDPSLYLSPGHPIFLSGFTPDTDTEHELNGGQIVASTFDAFTTTGDLTQGNAEVTNITTVADSGGNLAGTYFDFNSANDVTQYYLWFNVSGVGLDPLIPGKTGLRCNLVTGDADTVVATKGRATINSLASADFTASGATNVITITNTADGVTTDATPGTSGFTTLVTTQGVDGNIITSIADTSGINVGSHITSIDIPANTYVVSVGSTTITLSNSVTGSNVGATLNFDAGLTFNTDVTGTISTSLATIVDNEFRSIVQPDTPSTPATSAELRALQNYLEQIIILLQNEPNAVISTTLAAQFIDDLDITNGATVTLDITIPRNVTDASYFQIYRSDIATATGTTVLTDLTPNDEMRLVYEAFPTDAELALREIIVQDIVPDIFRGANLYTNEASGEGIAQANDLPPFAKDINRFKDVIFYANTKTLQRRLLSLLGVTNMLLDYFNGLNTKTFTSGDVNVATDTITISTHGYQDGQSVEFHNTVPSNLPGGILSSQTYYIKNSTTNTFQLSLIQGGTPIDITTTGTGTHTVFNQLPEIVITNGTVTNTYTFVRGQEESTKITTAAGSTLNSSGAASYFNLYSANDSVPYYVWYKIGTSQDPLVNGKIGIEVVAETTDTDDQIAEKTANTLARFANDFSVSVSTNEVTVTNVISGYTTDASDSSSPTDTGFTFLVLVQGVGEDASINQILLSNLISVGQAVDETARSLVRIINKNNNEIINAFYLSSENSVPGQLFFEEFIISDQPFYILANNENVGFSFSPDIAPDNFIVSNTAANPTVITSSSPHGLINGDQVVIAGSNSTPSLNGLHDITFISASTFSVDINVTVAGTTGSFIKAANGLFSDNEVSPNRIYYSKIQQPDAVPLVNFLDIGSKDRAILRIFPLRDSLFVFKEDGVFRISAETAPWVTALFDSSVIVIASDSLTVSNNMIFCWTTRGIIILTEGGTENISNQTINDIVKPLGSANYPSFGTATWGIGYESDNSYTVFTVKERTDTSPQVGYRYDQITNTWTTIEKDFTCGVIHQADDKMYAGSGDQNTIEKERKSFTRLDFADRELPLVLTPGQYFDTMMKFLVDISDMDEGDVLIQEQLLTIYQFNQTLNKLDIDVDVADSDYFTALEAEAGDSLRIDLVALANKLDADTGVDDTNYFDSIDTKTGSFSFISVSNPTIITTSSPHELQNGRIITITGSNSNPTINDTFSVTVTSASSFSIPFNVSFNEGNSGTFATIDTDFRDIQACYNFIIQKLNLDTGVNFSNYQESEGSTTQESIITGVSTIKKEITVNLALPYVQGPLIVFKAIPCSFTYTPITFNDALSLKHISESTMMFANKAFTSATLSFSSDLLPKFNNIPFFGDGNGIFGYSGNTLGFGSKFFGGGSSGAPFRTLIPLDNQRCRYLNIKFTHAIAREIFQIYGITLVGEVGQSSRAYR